MKSPTTPHLDSGAGRNDEWEKAPRVGAARVCRIVAQLAGPQKSHLTPIWVIISKAVSSGIMSDLHRVVPFGYGRFDYLLRLVGEEFINRPGGPGPGGQGIFVKCDDSPRHNVTVEIFKDYLV